MDTREITPDDNIEEAAEVTEEKSEAAENAGSIDAVSNDEEPSEAVEAKTDENEIDEIEDDFAVKGDEHQEPAEETVEAPAEEPKEKKPNPAVEKLKELRKLPWKRIGKISGAIASVLAVIYLIGVGFYSSHFAYNTALKIFECPNMTVEEAEATIKSGFGDYYFYIFERDNKVESISGKSIDLRCVSVSGVKEALQRQNPFAWPFPKAYQDVNITVDFNADKLYHEAEKLDCFARSIKDMDGAYAEYTIRTAHIICARCLTRTPSALKSCIPRCMRVLKMYIVICRLSRRAYMFSWRTRITYAMPWRP